MPRRSRPANPVSVAVLAALLAAGCSDAPSPGPLTPAEACADPGDCRLAEAGRIAGVRVGLASGIPEGRRREIVVAESTIHENHALSWNSIWPERGRWTFEDADRRDAFVEDNGMFQAGFHFAWHQVFLDDLPAWVKEIDDPDELRAVLRERARVIFERYPGLDRINVINEPLVTLGTSRELEKNFFYRVLGPDYVRQLFEIVDEFAPENVELALNENFVEYFPEKAEGLVELIRSLVEDGAPIDTVGFQSHLMLTEIFRTEPDFDRLRDTMQRVAALGVKVWISELDNPVDPARPDRFAYQAENYRRVVEACLAVPACTDILIWGVQDEARYWFTLPYEDAAPLLFDAGFRPKPAYFAVRDALLRGRP